MKHITTFITEAARGRANHTNLVRPCNDLIDEFNRLISSNSKSDKRKAILIIVSSGAAAGESLVNDFIHTASKNQIDSFIFSSASDKLVKITDARDIDHRGPHVNMDDVLNAILDDEIDTYDFNTVYILSDGYHNDSPETADLIKDLLNADVQIYGFSFGPEVYETSCKIVGDGADYKNALTGYFFNK